MTELRNSLFRGKTLFDIIESNCPVIPPVAAPVVIPIKAPALKPDKPKSRKASVVDLVALR